MKAKHSLSESKVMIPVPYWLMCSAWVLLSFSMASMMCFIPPGFLIDSVEKLVCAPVPADTEFQDPVYPDTTDVPLRYTATLQSEDERNTLLEYKLTIKCEGISSWNFH